MIWQMDKYSLGEYSINDELERLKAENERLHSQLRWLEYKIDLLLKKEDTKKDLVKTLVNDFKVICSEMGISKDAVLKIMLEK